MQGENATVVLQDSSLPLVFSIADETAVGSQRHYERLSAVVLCLFVATAVLGSFSFSIRNVDWAAYLALACLLIALLLQSDLLIRHPSETASGARRVAVETKSASWLYAVGGAPFSRLLSEDEARRALNASLRHSVEQLQNAELILRANAQAQVTPQMESLRERPLQVRRAAYESQRLIPEAQKYAQEFRVCDSRLRHLFIALLGVQVLAFLLATLKVAGSTNWDALGIGTTVAASITAWIQLRRYRAGRATAVQAQMRIVNAQEMLKADPPKGEEAWSRLVYLCEQEITGSNAVAKEISNAPRHRHWNWDEYAAAVQEVKYEFFDNAISRPHRVEPDVVIGLNGGGAIVGGMLLLYTRSFEFIPISFRMNDHGPAVHAVRAISKVTPRYGRPSLNILVVDSVWKTGTSQKRLKRLLESELAGIEFAVEIAVLVYRPGKLDAGQEDEIKPDYHVSTDIDYFPYGPI